MKRLRTKLVSLLGAAVMITAAMPTLPAYAADNYVQQNIKVTYTGQVADTFMGVDAVYATYYEWSGPYSCAAYIDNFYNKHFGVNLYDINNYAGKPRVYYPYAGHTAELVAVKDPIPGDIMQDKAYSHVAIVKAVNGSQATLIEQNWKWNDWATGQLVCTVNRKVNIADNYFYRLYIDGKPKTLSGVTEPTVQPEPEVKEAVLKLTGAEAESINYAGYNVTASATDTVGIDRFEFKTYPKSKGASAAKTKTVYKSGQSASALSAVRVYDYEYLEDTYVTVVTVYNTSGKSASKTIETVIRRSAPEISGVTVKNTSSSGYTVTCKVTGTDVKCVKFPTWTSYNSTDDINVNWQNSTACDGTLNGNTATFNVKTADHNKELGEYNTYIYAYDSFGNYSVKSVQVDLSKNVSGLTVSNIMPQNFTGGFITPSVKVKDGSVQLKEGVDYKLSYINNRLVGKGYVRITGIGEYSGSRVASFQIKPSKVTGVKVVKASTDSVELTWNKCANADKYYVYRKNGSSWKKAGSSETNTYTVTGLGIGENYEFAVASHSKNGSRHYISTYSDPVKAVTKTDQVTGVRANVSWGTANINWNTLDKADGYAIYVSTDGNSYTRYICIDDRSASSYSLTGFTGKVYVKIRGYKLIGNTHYYGEYSDEVTFNV